jgi:hypothetical protein
LLCYITILPNSITNPSIYIVYVLENSSINFIHLLGEKSKINFSLKPQQKKNHRKFARREKEITTIKFDSNVLEIIH